MKVRRLVNSILTFGMVFFLFITLPVFEQTAYAGNALEPKLNVSSQKIVKGKTFSLRIYNLKSSYSVVYNSSRPGIATVDSSGVVLARDNGETTVTARIFDGSKIVTTLVCTISVGPPAVSIMISKLDLDLAVGEQFKLSYLIFPTNTAETPVYSSNDESIASVTPGGRVKGEGVGQTQIYCMISRGTYATCAVNVYSDEPEPEPEEESEPSVIMDQDVLPEEEETSDEEITSEEEI